MSTSPAPPWLVVGRVLAAFGTRGEIRVLPETDFPQRFKRGAHLHVEGDERAFTVQSSRPQKGQLILKLRGIDDRDQAVGLSGRSLQVPGDDLAPLEEGEYYVFQIVGLDVRTEEGRDLGKVTEVLQTGANDVYVVKRDGKEALLPAIPDVIRNVDLAAGLLTVHLLPGLVDE